MDRKVVGLLLIRLLFSLTLDTSGKRNGSPCLGYHASDAIDSRQIDRRGLLYIDARPLLYIREMYVNKKVIRL